MVHVCTYMYVCVHHTSHITHHLHIHKNIYYKTYLVYYIISLLYRVPGYTTHPLNSSLILHLKLLAGSKPCGHLHLYHLAIGALHLNQLATDCAWRDSNRHYLRLWNSNHGVW